MLLHAGYIARKSRHHTLVAITLGKLSLVAPVKEYLERYAPLVNWLMVAPNGSVRWCIDEKHGEHQGLVEPADVSTPRRKPARRDPFAPKFQWLLKLILLSGLNPEYWGGPREHPNTLGDLVRLTGVSQPYVSMFAQVMESRDYLRRERRNIHIPNVERVLEDWAAATDVGRRQEVAVRSIYGPLDNLQTGVLERLGQYDGRYAVTSHAGAKLLGLARSNALKMKIYVEGDMSEALEALRLVPAQTGVSSLMLAHPISPDAVFGGATERSGVYVADALQCYLDIRGNTSRGVEQSDHIFNRVLEPHFTGRGWL